MVKRLVSIKSLRNVRNLIILLLVLNILALLMINLPTFENVQETRDYIQGFGILAPLIIIILITLEVIIAPIPGFIIIIAAGAIYGPLYGTLFAYIAHIIGASVAFLLAKRFGRPLVKKIVRNEKLDLYDCFFRENGRYALWLFFLFPIFPSDIIAFVAGLSKLRYRDFLFIIGIAYIPNMFIITTFGDQIFRFGYSLQTIIVGSLLAFVFIFGSVIYFYLYKKSNAKCKAEISGLKKVKK